MISRLFARRRSAADAAPRRGRVAPGKRVYAIGDIHGRLDLLKQIHDLLNHDITRSSADEIVVVYLGDYIDRGLESRQVIDWLIDHPMPASRTVHLMGNHEQSLLRFLGDVSIGPSWMQYGGRETLHSYGIALERSIPSMTERLRRAQGELQQRLPERQRDFLEMLESWHVEDEYLFVHAGVRPGVKLEDQRLSDLLWIREEFLNSGADHGHIVVHGHTITEAPETLPNRIGIDTGAFMTGRLTCLVLQDDKRTFIQTGSS